MTWVRSFRAHGKNIISCDALWGGQSRGCDPYFMVQGTEIETDWVTCPESQHWWVMGLRQGRDRDSWTHGHEIMPWIHKPRALLTPFPTSSCPKDAAGRQLVLGGGAWPKRMAQIWTHLLALRFNPWPQIQCLSPKCRPPDGPGYPNMCASSLPSPSALDSSSWFAVRLPGGQVTTLNDQ